MHNYSKAIYKKTSKLSKEQIQTLMDELVQENEQLSCVIDSLYTGLLIVDNDFHLKNYNIIAESKLNFCIHCDDQKIASIPLWQAIENTEIASFLENCAKKDITNSSEEFSISTESGTIIFISVTILPLNKNGTLDGRIILIRDITDKKNQEILMHRMENMANLTNLAAGMAHDIKNPLGAISIHIQLIQKALEKARNNNNILPDKKFVEDHITVVNEEIDHLNSLVMDFLFAVRPLDVKLELKNPIDTINNSVIFIKPEFSKENIEIICNFNASSEKILIDEKLFREVIMNLAQNSLAALKSKFNKDTSHIQKPVFSVNTFVQENKYVVKFSDNGCGMSPEVLSKIFEPYYTTKSNGTGLGMTMVYKIVKEFSGDIRVESKENIGSSFTMIFPLPNSNKKLLK